MKHKSEFISSGSVFKVAVIGEDGRNLYRHFYDAPHADQLFDHQLPQIIPFKLPGNKHGIQMFFNITNIPKAQLAFNYQFIECNLIALCFNPNNEQYIENLKKNYSHIESSDAKIICIYTQQPNNLAQIALTKIFAKETKISDVLSLDQFASRLTELTEDQLDLTSVLKTLNLAQYNQSFKDGSKLYVNRNPSQSTVTTLFSFGSKNCQQKIMEQRMPVVATELGCLFGLYNFLKGEGALNPNSYKRCVLEVLFPQLKPLSFEDFKVQVTLLEKILTRTLDKKLSALREVYKNITVAAALENLNQYCESLNQAFDEQDKNMCHINFPPEVALLIQQKYVELTIQEEAEAIQTSSKV